MELLPKSHIDFANEKYWDEFFKKLRSQPFEWYGEYNELCDVMNKYIKMTDKILVVGCGNSSLSADLYNVGYFNISNIDISATVIQQMKDKYSQDRPFMVFERMDMLQMTYQDETFNVVLDKGTLDALMVDNSFETVSSANKMFSEISRVLKFGGRYICVSLLQEHILRRLLSWFVEQQWLIRVNRCFQAESADKTLSLSFPVFLIVCTKMKKTENPMKVLEVATDVYNTLKRVASEEELIETVKSSQYFAILKHSLSNGKITDDAISLDLCCAKSGKPKYRLFVVDSEEETYLKYAVFIVPQGREREWLFASPEGRKECAANAKCERLIIVHLLRDFQHEDLEEVKRDLSANVMDLAPVGLRSQVPFLSVGDDVGFRNTRFSGNSEFSGSFVVEDVKQGDEEFYRQLIFLDKPNLIQSEAKLIKVKTKKKGKKCIGFKINFDYLACEHHSTMVAGLAFLESRMTSPKILLIGLGGGSLAMFLHKHFPLATIETVELDPSIIKTAKNWFGFEENEKLSVHIGDGLDYIQQLASNDNLYDIIMIDVDNKDVSVGMSCPPAEFVSDAILSTMSKLVAKTGIVIINCACRDQNLLQDVFAKIHSLFTSVFHRKIPDEVNDIIFCMNFDISLDEIKHTPISEHIKKYSSSYCIEIDNIIEKIVHKVLINDENS